MVGASGMYPRRSRSFQVGLGLPKGPCRGELGHGLLGLDHVYHVHNHPESVPHVHHGGVHRLPGGGVENQTHRVFFAPYPKGVHLTGGLS